MFNIFLKTGKQYDAISFNNDAMALGVIEALKNMEYPEDVPVLGVDATAKGCGDKRWKDGIYCINQQANKANTQHVQP